MEQYAQTLPPLARPVIRLGRNRGPGREERDERGHPAPQEQEGAARIRPRYLQAQTPRGKRLSETQGMARDRCTLL